MDSGKIVTNYNKDNFLFLCKEFADLGLKRCYFSYVTDYTKFINRFRKKYSQLKILTGQQELFNEIHNEMREIAVDNQITLYTCCNDKLISMNTEKGRCISGILLNELAGKKTVSETRAPTRKDCGCTRSIDIGDYLEQPCYFGCIYCYANPVWE
jgi:hypothetical protein